MFTDILRNPAPLNGGREITFFTLLQILILWKYLLFVLKGHQTERAM